MDDDVAAYVDDDRTVAAYVAAYMDNSVSASVDDDVAAYMDDGVTTFPAHSP